MIMLHGDFQLQKVLPKINVARKLNVKKSCNEELLDVRLPLVHDVDHRGVRARHASHVHVPAVDEEVVALSL